MGEELWSITNAHKGDGGITALALSNNGRFVVSGGVEGEVRLWELRSREMVSHLKEHSTVINDLTLYQDDVHLLSCSRDRAILCWDLKAEQRITSHRQRMGGISALAISKDEMQVVSVGQEKTIAFWDLREQDPVFIQRTDHDEQTSLSISHGGDMLATGGASGNVKLWSLPSCSLVCDIEGHSLGGVSNVEFSEDDRQLISVGIDGSIISWRITN